MTACQDRCPGRRRGTPRPPSAHLALGLLTALGLAGCAVGPDYERPAVATPAAYKEAGDWRAAAPRDAQPRGPWWELFGDSELNGLQPQVVVANQQLQAAAARYRQAQALGQATRAGRWPVLTASGSTSRGKNAGGSLASSSTLALDASWEADLWGRLGRGVEAADASTAASAADLEAARLSLQAELAIDFFHLRALDSQQALFADTLAAYAKSLELTRNRYAAGVAARADVVQAEALLKQTEAQAIDLRAQRAQVEHAIALLVGRPPADFSLPAAPLAAEAPPLPAGLPAELLERRPDIAAAERRVAAANAQVGVASAAFYPALTLSASLGSQSTGFAKWLTAPHSFWAVGPALAQPLFDGGLRSARSAQAKAAYEESVASYRQTVLAGFQEVEDSLAALRYLGEEAAVQQEALAAAREAVALATNQYRAGLVSYLNVVTAQTTALANERTAVDLRDRRLAASVQLLRALGGGWTTTPVAGTLPGAPLAATDSVSHAAPR